MKLPTWVRSWRDEVHTLRERDSRRLGAPPEVDRVLALLKSAGEPPPSLGDRVLARLRVEQADTGSWLENAGRKRLGRGSYGLVDVGLATGAVCLLGILILSSGFHRGGQQAAAIDRLQPTTRSNWSATPIDQERGSGIKVASVPSLGLAAARREPPRPVATGLRAGRLSVAAGNRLRRGRVRRPSTP